MFLAFIIGALQRVSISVVGQLYISELIAIFAGPFLFVLHGWGIWRVRGAKLVFSMGIMWISALILSDIANQTSFANLIRGWANAFMTIYLFMFFLVLFRADYRNYGAYLLGLVPSGLVSVFVQKGQTLAGAGDEVGDVLLSAWATPLVVLIAWYLYRRQPKSSIGLLVGYGLLLIVTGGRSAGLIMIMAASMLCYARWASAVGYKLSYRDVAKLVAMATIVLSILFVFYVHLGVEGWLGKKSQTQLQSLRNPYNPFYVVMIARTDFLVSLVAVKDAPLLGHGSWARDNRYLRVEYDMTVWLSSPRAQIRMPQPPEKGFLVPVHSTVLGAWVNSGILGGIAWLVITVLCLMQITYFIKRPYLTTLPVVMVMICQISWDSLFSPLGKARFVWAGLFAFCLATRYHSEMMEYCVWPGTLPSEQQALRMHQMPYPVNAHRIRP